MYVDLDHTLIRTDLLWESLLAVARQTPWVLWMVPLWLANGKARLKHELAMRAKIDVATLPYCEEVLTGIRRAKASGKRVVLATAAAEPLARRIAAHLGLFDAVLATRATNLKGLGKLSAIQADARGDDFEYWGDSVSDLPLFAAAASATVVRPSTRLRRRALDIAPSVHIIDRRSSPLVTWLKAIRVHQWVKNVLLLLPLLASHQVFNLHLLGLGLLSFVLFSLLASGNYLLNDLLDLSSDRLHPWKRGRALASGAISIPAALCVAIAMLATAAALTAAFAPPRFWLWLAGYFALTNLYSIRLKQMLLLDVMILSSLYTIRIMAGGDITGIELSEWLLAFSMFLFTSLAFAKRFIELKETLTTSDAQLSGRAYQHKDLEMVRVIGPVSGYIAVLVIALYINSPATLTLYPHPRFLWLICALLAYWITRIWFLANRGEMHHDPIVFALRDVNSYVIGTLAVAAAVAATI